MEECNSNVGSQNIAKEDLHLLAKITYDWSNANFQVIELEELGNVRYHNAGERYSLIININDQWNTFIKDEKNKTYLGYTDAKIRDYLEQQLKANSFKKPHSIKINNHGISAVINVTVINVLLDNSQTVSADIKKWDTTDLRSTLTECLKMIRGINDKFKSLHDKHFNFQRHQPVEKKAGMRIQSSDKKVDDQNPPSEVEAIKQAVKRAQNELQAMESLGTPPKVNKPSQELCTDVVPLRVIIRNKEPMSYAQMEAVHDCIKENILLIEKNETARKYLGHTFEHGGSVIITCANTESMQWLLETVPNMQPWNGAELSIKPESELLETAKYKTYIPSNEASTVDRALYMIKKQNQELNSEQWWVLKGTKSKNGFIVTVALNETCAKALRKNKLSVAIGITSIKFQAIGVNTKFPQRHRASTSDADAMTDLQSETRSPNKTVSSWGSKKISISKAPGKAMVPGPSVTNNNQHTQPIVSASPPGQTGFQVGSPMSHNSLIPEQQLSDIFAVCQLIQRLSQGYK